MEDKTDKTKTDEINELIDKALRFLTVSLDSELYLPVKEELKQKKVTHCLGFKKELFKEKMEKTFQELKIEIAKINNEKKIDEKILKTGECT